jgi:hypothetical protein
LNSSVFEFWVGSSIYTISVGDPDEYNDYLTFAGFKTKNVTIGPGKRSPSQALQALGNVFYQTADYQSGSFTIGSEFHFNNIMAFFNANHVGSFCSNNLIGEDCSQNMFAQINDSVIGTNCMYNEVFRQFASNIIGNNFTKNSVGASFTANIVGDDFKTNNIPAQFQNDDYTSGTLVKVDQSKQFMKSPDGTKFIITASNAGTLTLSPLLS